MLQETLHASAGALCDQPGVACRQRCVSPQPAGSVNAGVRLMLAGNMFKCVAIVVHSPAQPSTSWKSSAQTILHGRYCGTHTAYDTSGCVVSCSNTASLSASLICLLSFSSSNSMPGGSTAAAATTGPANGPLPASSTPATAW